MHFLLARSNVSVPFFFRIELNLLWIIIEQDSQNVTEGNLLKHYVYRPPPQSDKLSFFCVLCCQFSVFFVVNFLSMIKNVTFNNTKNNCVCFFIYFHGNEKLSA